MAELENTGERMIPEVHKGSNKYGAHLIRYQAAVPFAKDKVVLDIACGTGYGSRLLAEEAKLVYGVDLSSESIAYAEKHYGRKNIQYLTGDAIAIPLDENSVDVVVSYETIEHVSDYQKFMKEIKRVLRPDGTLIISSPNSKVSFGGNDFHVKEFTLEELKDLIAEHFKCQQMYHQSLWLFSSLLNLDSQNKEWQKNLMIMKTAAANGEETEFYLCVASDSKISTSIEEGGVISEYHRQQPSMKRELSKLKSDLNSTNKKLAEAEKKAREARGEADGLRKQLKAIQESKAWTLTRNLQKLSARARFKAKT